MDLKKYKYIKNKPRFDSGTDLLQGPVVHANWPNFTVISDMLAKQNDITNIKNTPIDTSRLKLTPDIKNNTTVNFNKLAPNIISSGLQFGTSMINALNTNNVQNVDQLIGNSGTSQGYVNGVGYEKYNAIDSKQAMDQINQYNTQSTLQSTTSGASVGSAIGSIGGPVGSAIGGVIGGITGLVGGLFGGSRRKKRQQERIFNARQQISAFNNFNQSGAMTTSLQNQYNSENSNTDGILYANNGKDMNRKVWTPDGYKNGVVNSYVGRGESIIDYTNGTGTLVTKGTRGIDNQPSSVKNGDNNVIIGNDVDWTNGIRFSDQAAPFTAQLEQFNKYDKAGRFEKKSSLSKFTKDIQDREVNKLKTPILDKLNSISYKQQLQHEIENKHPKYKFDEGSDMPWYLRLAPSAYGYLQAYNQYKTYDNEPLRYTNTYRSNPYENIALKGLSQLRYDATPAVRAARESESRSNYSINNAGGLTGAQKYLARIQNAANTQRAIADIYGTAQINNNKYKQDYYNSLMSAGEQNRSKRMQALQNDYNNYVYAHGAKYKGRDMAIANMINQINSGFSNEFKYRTFQDTLDMYRQKLSEDNKNYINSLHESLAKYSGSTNDNSTSTSVWNPTQYSWYKPVIQYDPDAFKLDFTNLWRTKK